MDIPQPNSINFGNLELENDVENQENFQPARSLQISSATSHPSNKQRVSRSKHIRPNPNVSRWAHELELKRKKSEQRWTAVVEKQTQVQLEIMSEMRDIKLALLELTAAVKGNKKTSIS